MSMPFANCSPSSQGDSLGTYAGNERDRKLLDGLGTSVSHRLSNEPPAVAMVQRGRVRYAICSKGTPGFALTQTFPRQLHVPHNLICLNSRLVCLDSGHSKPRQTSDLPRIAT